MVNTNTMKSLLLILLCSLPFISAAKTFKGINENGEVVFTIEAKSVSAFSDGLARIRQQRLINNVWVTGYGYINTKGEIVIECIYDKAHDFVDDRAWVKKENENHWTLINKKGEIIPTKEYEKVGYIIKGYSDRIAVYENGAMGWIDRDGNEVIPCKYLGSSTFDPEFGLACVMPWSGTEEKYGFINKYGEIVIPYQFKQAGTSSFHNGFCRVSVGGKTVLINEKGEVIFTPKYNSLQNYSNGLMPVSTKPNRSGWGYVNLKNEMIIPAKYDDATVFNDEGFAIVELDKRKGLIDTTGKIVLAMDYSTIYCNPTDDGYICGVLPVAEPTSLLKTPKKYFDARLNPIDVGDATLMPAEGGTRIPFMTLDGKRGFMDREYNIVIPATYSKATVFHDGISLVSE